MTIPRPTPSMAVACAALFTSLGGVSYAAVTGSIDSKAIKDSSITSRDVRNNSLVGADIVEARLGRVPRAKLADTATSATTAKTATTATSATTATTAGSAAPSGPAGGVLAGSYPAPSLAAGKVDSAALADDGVTGADVLESSLGTVPNAASLGGRAAATFLASAVYRRESATDQGTVKGDGTYVKNQACDPGDVLLAGGPANVDATTDMVESFPTPGDLGSWSVRVQTVGADTFSVVINCIDQG